MDGEKEIETPQGPVGKVPGEPFGDEQRLFLKMLELEGGRKTAAAGRMGRTRQAINYHIQRDPEFRRAVEEAQARVKAASRAVVAAKKGEAVERRGKFFGGARGKVS